jgi:hypothetical protein
LQSFLFFNLLNAKRKVSSQFAAQNFASEVVFLADDKEIKSPSSEISPTLRDVVPISTAQTHSVIKLQL